VAEWSSDSFASTEVLVELFGTEFVCAFAFQPLVETTDNVPVAAASTSVSPVAAASRFNDAITFSIAVSISATCSGSTGRQLVGEGCSPIVVATRSDVCRARARTCSPYGRVEDAKLPTRALHFVPLDASANGSSYPYS